MGISRCSNRGTASSWPATPAWHILEAEGTSAAYTNGSCSSSSWTTSSCTLDDSHGIGNLASTCLSFYASGTL